MLVLAEILEINPRCVLRITLKLSICHCIWKLQLPWTPWKRHLLRSGPLKDALWVHSTYTSAWENLSRSPMGAFARVVSFCLRLQGQLNFIAYCPTASKTVAFRILSNFSVVWCTQGNLVPITVFWQKVEILPVNTLLISSFPFKTVGTTCLPVSIWWIHIYFFCSSLSLPPSPFTVSP